MDQNSKTEIEKNKGLPKENNKYNKENEKEKDITELKEYRVPDAISEKIFDKINKSNFIGITKFITFPEMIEISLVNKIFYDILNHLIKSSLKNLTKNIFLNFSEDFHYLLRKNSSSVTEIMKQITESSRQEYIPRSGAMKYFLSKIKSNPDIKDLYLGNCDIGKKSMKYLSYYFCNKNCNITDIDINGNKITGLTLKPLAKKKNIIINYLNANKCFIDSNTFIYLSNLNVKKLSLSNNNIDIEFISKL